MLTAPLVDAAPPRRCCAALCVTRHRPRGLGRRISRFSDVHQDVPEGYCGGWKMECGRTDADNLRSPTSWHGGTGAGCAAGLRAACAPSRTDAVAASLGHPATNGLRWGPASGCPDVAARTMVRFTCAKTRNQCKWLMGSWGPHELSAARGCAFAVRGCARHAARVKPQQNRRDPAFLLRLH